VADCTKWYTVYPLHFDSFDGDKSNLFLFGDDREFEGDCTLYPGFPPLFILCYVCIGWFDACFCSLNVLKWPLLSFVILFVDCECSEHFAR